jgi:hypothetical protein
MVEPELKNKLGWSFTTLATEQLSAVIGVPSDAIVALQELASALTFTEGGQVILGFWVSVTVMI